MTAPVGLVIDTSAVVAVLGSEPGSEQLIVDLERAAVRLMSAATLVEVGIVVGARLGPAGAAIVERFVRDSEVDIVPVDVIHARHALDGWHRFGKGRHPAALNYGDCFTYGLAVVEGLPVLCVGNDFAATDVAVVRPTS